MEYIEVTGRTIDDALTNACLKLETTSDNIEYEGIEKGSNGLFGIFNSKPTKIKARVKAGVSSVDDEFSKLEAKEKKSIDDTIKSEIKAESKKEVVKETEKAVKKETAPKADNSKVSATQAVNASEEDLEEKANNNEPRPVLSNEEIESRIRTFLGDMFSAMDIPVEVKITFDTEEECVNVELIGENMGLLIGKRGQTLDSIQYLTSLVLNKGKEKYVRIKVDTENYRQRRKDTLESLAKNIAYKVKRTRRPVSLEPMNPYERRIIHAAVQNDKYVTTRSEGEEPFRHVVIALKKEAVSGERKGRYDRAGRGRSYGYKGNNRRGGSYQTAPKAEPVTETVSESAQE